MKVYAFELTDRRLMSGQHETYRQALTSIRRKQDMNATKVRRHNNTDKGKRKEGRTEKTGSFNYGTREGREEDLDEANLFKKRITKVGEIQNNAYPEGKKEE